MEAILFDWDGTLVDSLGAFHAANATVMRAFDLPFDEVVYRRNYVPDWRQMYVRLGIPADRLDEANALWEQTFAGSSDLVVAFVGATEALRDLGRTGAVLGIVTAGLREVVEPQLERTGLGSYLPVRVFGDDLPVHKPDPAPLRLALELAGDGHRPETSIYVGDAPTDMRMAVTAGARGVGIESVLGDPDELRAAGASEIAPSVAAWADRHLAERRAAATSPAAAAPADGSGA
ncbi:MAG TPA: HAD family hydrolase [Verrucomicrobiae bacterium]|nr:HAD family hydrolase [Verrucomicrobiae bacterium]